MRYLTKHLTLLVALAVASASTADEHRVGQRNNEFTTESLTVKVGDSVAFVNEDTFFHNVYSLSDAKTFDLGSFPQGESKSVTFDSAGEVEVECAIHPNMFMTITVED